MRFAEAFYGSTKPVPMVLFSPDLDRRETNAEMFTLTRHARDSHPEALSHIVWLCKGRLIDAIPNMGVAGSLPIDIGGRQASTTHPIRLQSKYVFSSFNMLEGQFFNWLRSVPPGDYVRSIEMQARRALDTQQGTGFADWYSKYVAGTDDGRATTEAALEALYRHTKSPSQEDKWALALKYYQGQASMSLGMLPTPQGSPLALSFWYCSKDDSKALHAKEVSRLELAASQVAPKAKAGTPVFGKKKK
jgi:hypothetical protein